MCHSNLFISLVVKLPPIKLRSGVAGPRRKKRNGSCVAGFLPVPPGNPARAPRCMKCIYVMCSNPRYCVQFKYLIRFNDILLGWRESGAKRRRFTPQERVQYPFCCGFVFVFRASAPVWNCKKWTAKNCKCANIKKKQQHRVQFVFRKLAFKVFDKNNCANCNFCNMCYANIQK
jgi:hypothetical protein